VADGGALNAQIGRVPRLLSMTDDLRFSAAKIDNVECCRWTGLDAAEIHNVPAVLGRRVIDHNTSPVSETFSRWEREGNLCGDERGRGEKAVKRIGENA
jgi:hypothetical protein